MFAWEEDGFYAQNVAGRSPGHWKGFITSVNNEVQDNICGVAGFILTTPGTKACFCFPGLGVFSASIKIKQPTGS